jgi:DNA-binding GntR family transcriptional regulator
MSVVLSRIAQLAAQRFQTATAYVSGALREAIVAGELEGGFALRQEDIAAAFSVSRMPVREALRQLEAEGLIDFIPYRGAVVASLSAEDMHDVYDIRAALEPVALRLSLPSLTAEDLQRAAEILEEIDSEDDVGRWGELNARFHLTLYGRAGRKRLLDLLQIHLRAGDRYLRLHHSQRDRRPDSQAEHRALLTACHEKDEERACSILHHHILDAKTKLDAFLTARHPTDAPTTLSTGDAL